VVWRITPESPTTHPVEELKKKREFREAVVPPGPNCTPHVVPRSVVRTNVPSEPTAYTMSWVINCTSWRSFPWGSGFCHLHPLWAKEHVLATRIATIQRAKDITIR
jgi:hypothetical protein